MKTLQPIQRELLKKEAVDKIHIKAVKIWNLEILSQKVLQVAVSYIREIAKSRSKNRLLLTWWIGIRPDKAWESSHTTRVHKAKNYFKNKESLKNNSPQ